jgi:Ethanolamine utilization protein EutJ (predicted chaperonin)
MSMKKLIILSMFLSWCFHAKSNDNVDLISPLNYTIDKKDSSNYTIKVVRSDINYCQIRFTIVDQDNNPLGAIMSLNDKDGKGISGLVTNNDGKIIVTVFDIITKVIIYRIGHGVVKIPLDKYKDKIIDVRVQLYRIPSSD